MLSQQEVKVPLLQGTPSPPINCPWFNGPVSNYRSSPSLAAHGPSTSALVPELASISVRLESCLGKSLRRSLLFDTSVLPQIRKPFWDPALGTPASAPYQCLVGCRPHLWGLGSLQHRPPFWVPPSHVAQLSLGRHTPHLRWGALAFVCLPTRA